MMKKNIKKPEDILNLIKDNELLKTATPKLYDETVKVYGNNKTK